MFQKANVKKSGRNTFSKYNYFELDDIVPPKTEIFNELALCDIISFSDTEATLTLVNIEKPEETLEFKSPMRDLELKGANAVQLLGGVETYQRRYLYMMVLDIVENDQFDQAQTPQNNNSKPQPKASSAFADEVVAIVSALTPEQRKAAGELIAKLNNGSMNFRDITDSSTQASILKALKEAYPNG